MKRIVRIDHTERRLDKHRRVYFRTHAILDTGEEAVGYGNNFQVGDLVEYWFDKQWNVCKMQKKDLNDSPGEV